MMMKIHNLLVLLTMSAMLLVGCSNATAATITASNVVPNADRLAAGTLRLEGTSQAVTSSQAGELLNLWEAYQSLTKSDMTSIVELEALVKQIGGVMTSDQLQAIEAMNLSDQAVNELAQSLASSANTSLPASTPSSSSLSQAAPGGMPGSMPGGGDESVMSAIGGGMEAASTPAATQPAASSQDSQVNALLLNVLVQLLETRSQSGG